MQDLWISVREGKKPDTKENKCNYIAQFNFESTNVSAR
jgi:hypothetical protein